MGSSHHLLLKIVLFDILQNMKEQLGVAMRLIRNRAPEIIGAGVAVGIGTLGYEYSGYTLPYVEKIKLQEKQSREDYLSSFRFWAKEFNDLAERLEKNYQEGKK